MTHTSHRQIEPWVKHNLIGFELVNHHNDLLEELWATRWWQFAERRRLRDAIRVIGRKIDHHRALTAPG